MPEKEKYAQRLLDAKCGICGLDVKEWVGDCWNLPSQFCSCDKPVRRSDVLRSMFGPPVKYEAHYGFYGR